MMLEEYTSIVENDFLKIRTLLSEGAFQEVYRRYSPVLEDMLYIGGEAEWLDYVDQQGPELEERSLRLHLAAWRNCCLEVGGYEGDVTEKLAEFLRKNLPEKLYDKLERPAVNVDIDEFSGELEPQLKPYQEQLEPWGCKLKAFFEDTYCAGLYFLFLEMPRQR